MTQEHNSISIDWAQVVVNLETLIEIYGYSYGLYHDLAIAKGQLAETT